MQAHCNIYFSYIYFSVPVGTPNSIYLNLPSKISQIWLNVIRLDNV